ncbi:MAG TPA: NAD-dependent epimerase/dehydratase family protein [Micromonosporaceae bacterium]|jgi:UDP-glucose 4-epimerase
MFAGEHILVTGGSGFIGRSIVPALVAAGARVTVADRIPYPDASVPTVGGDLCDPAVRDTAVTEDLTGIVHLAAITSVLGSLADPGGVHENNVTVTAGLLELARRRSVNRFVMASTNAVTGDIGTGTIHEGLPLRPLTPYGATKAAAEMLLSGYAGGYGMTTCALRLTNVYGPGMELKDSFVPRLMRAAMKGTGVQIYGDGLQRRDLVHVDDVVAGLFVAWSAAHTGALIIGAGRSITVLDIVAGVERVVGEPIAREHVPAKPGEMPAVIVSIDQARALGYLPSVSLDAGLETVWCDLRRSE